MPPEVSPLRAHNYSPISNNLALYGHTAPHASYCTQKKDTQHPPNIPQRKQSARTHFRAVRANFRRFLRGSSSHGQVTQLLAGTHERMGMGQELPARCSDRSGVGSVVWTSAQWVSTD